VSTLTNQLKLDLNNIFGIHLSYHLLFSLYMVINI